MICQVALAWAFGGALAGGVAGILEWNFEPERLAPGATLATHVAWRICSSTIFLVAGSLAAYVVARPIEPSEMWSLAVVPLVLSLGSTSPARFLGRLLYLVLPLGLVYGAWLRVSRNRGRGSRSDDETSGRNAA